MTTNPIGKFDEPLFPISVKGIVIKDGKVHLRKNERGEWELPGGRIDQGEQPEEALMREIEEELGFEVSIVNPVLNKILEVPNHVTPKVFVAIYVCEFKKDVGRRETADEEDWDAEYGVFSPEDIIGLNIPELYKQAISKAVG